MRQILVILTIGATLACGSSSPTSPTPSAPQVAGNYTGGVTISYPSLGRTVTCQAATTINQQGFNLSIAPMILTGVCGTISIPIGDTTIDANGSIGQGSGSFSEPSCGIYSFVGSGGFFGREFRLSAIYTSQTCPPFTITGVLLR